MSTPGDTRLNFENLQSDVIRKIITVGLDSIDIMKLINPRWNALVLEYLGDRNRHPALRQCNAMWVGGAGSSIIITYPIALINYFGMMHKSITNQFFIEKLGSEYRRGFEFGKDNAEQESEDIEFLRRVFRRCSSVKEFTIHFPAFGNGESIKTIKYITGPLKIEELRITGEYADKDTDEIEKFVKDSTVRLLSLAAFGIDFVTKSGNFFIEILSVVATIKFERKELASYPLQLDIHRRAWQKAADWLNKTGKIKAKFNNERIDEMHVKMCITIEMEI